MQLIDQSSAVHFIRAMAPDWAWLLLHIESEQGYVRFPPLFSRWINDLNIGNYPELYEDRIAAMLLRAFVARKDIKELDAELVSMSPDERAAFVLEAVEGMMLAGDAFELPKTSAEQKESVRGKPIQRAITNTACTAPRRLRALRIFGFTTYAIPGHSCIVRRERLAMSSRTWAAGSLGWWWTVMPSTPQNIWLSLGIGFSGSVTKMLSIWSRFCHAHKKRA